MPLLLLDLLASRFPESTRTTLRAMIADKRVLVNGTPARTLKQEVQSDVTIEILARVDARKRVAGNVPYKVVFEDADLILIDKPAGVITSSGDNDKRATAIDILTNYFAGIDTRIVIGLIHRLDKDASGLLVFSKNARAYESFKAQFADKSAKRFYHAIVTGVPKLPKGTIESKLVELADGSVKSTKHRDYGEEARTHYEVLETRGVPSATQHSLLRVELDTGRKHQIRVHLAERGWPIAGDTIYHPNPAAAERLMLAAVELTLTHPRTMQSHTFKIPAPDALSAYWKSLIPS